MNELIVVEKIEGWEKLKALVLDSVSSPITKHVYNADVPFSSFKSRKGHQSVRAIIEIDGRTGFEGPTKQLR
jgi:hypothetical protein